MPIPTRICSFVSMLKAASYLTAILVIFADASNGFVLRSPSPSSPSHIQVQRRQHHANSALSGFTRDSSETKPKRQREKKMKKLTFENDMMTNHKHRLETAGKIGTQRYADPNTIFVGNLNFTATDEQVKELVLPLVPSPWDVAKVQIVRDWKTGTGKGYAFVRFTEAIFATLALQELDNKEFLGRPLKVKAASSRSESPLRKKQREEKERMKALRRTQNPPPPPPAPKNENAEFLALLDADLVIPTFDDKDDDDDDDEVDGWEVPGSPAPKGFG